jgi:hypothetical protein
MLFQIITAMPACSVVVVVIAVVLEVVTVVIVAAETVNWAEYAYFHSFLVTSSNSCWIQTCYMLGRVSWIVTPYNMGRLGILEEHIASDTRVEEWAKQETCKNRLSLPPLSVDLFAWLTLLPWRLRWNARPEHRAFSELHGISTQKTVLFIVTTMKTSTQHITCYLNIWIFMAAQRMGVEEVINLFSRKTSRIVKKVI